MANLKRLIHVIALAFLTGCASKLVTPTAVPSLTGYPAPQAGHPATELPSQACEKWNTVHPKVGDTICIEGVVVKSSIVNNDFIMEFEEGDNAIYGVAHNYIYLYLDGKCARMTGEVKQDDKGRYYLQLDLPGQVVPCSP
jgi:hypothetical protein